MLCVQEKLSIKAREGFFSLVLYVQGLKKTQASKLGRKSSGGSSWKKKFSCGLSLVLLIVHALLPGSPHGRTWVDFFPFVFCKFVAMVMVGLAMAMGGFHNCTTVVFILDSMFLMLLFFSVALLLVVAFYCFVAPYGFALPPLVVKLYCSSWSRFATPRGRTLLFFLVVTLCYFLWSSFAAPCGHALLLLVGKLYSFEVWSF